MFKMQGEFKLCKIKNDSAVTFRTVSFALSYFAATGEKLLHRKI